MEFSMVMVDYWLGPDSVIYWIAVGYAFLWLTGANYLLAVNYKRSPPSKSKKLGFLGMLFLCLVMAIWYSRLIAHFCIILKDRPQNGFGLFLTNHPTLLIIALAFCVGLLIGWRAGRLNKGFKEPSALKASFLHLAMPGWGMLSLNLNAGLGLIILLFTVLSLLFFGMALLVPVGNIFKFHIILSHLLITLFHPLLAKFTKVHQRIRQK